jgi:hypothetical protein
MGGSPGWAPPTGWLGSGMVVVVSEVYSSLGWAPPSAIGWTVVA